MEKIISVFASTLLATSLFVATASAIEKNQESIYSPKL